jgi:uncharacterized protein YwgA
MKNDYLRILSALKFLNLEITSPTLSKATRIFIQKFAYILKQTGFSFSNYDDYNFYLNGMYSPNLTYDYYHIRPENYANLERGFQENEIKALNLYRQYIGTHSLFQSHQIEFHEAITTLIYLKHVYSNSTERELRDKAKELKRHLSAKIITISQNVVKQLQFSSEMITQEIQEEFQLWDSLNDE